jgi:hypothetical protein
MTSSRALASLFAAVAALSLVACGTDCQLTCEKTEEADCFGDPVDVHDCERECKHTADLVLNAECDAEYDAYLVCIDDLDDVCEQFQNCDSSGDCSDPKCDNEIEDLVDCFTDYCTDHPRNNECESGI